METHFRQGRQTVKLGLIKVIHDLFPEEKLKVSYSIPGGLFCNLDDSVLSVREVNLINARLREWVKRNTPINLLSKKDGFFQYQVGDLTVKTVYKAYTTPSKGEPFWVIPFSYGFIVYFGEDGKDIGKVPFAPYHLSAAYEKTQRWLNNIDIEFVGNVNSYIASGQSVKILSIAEALHEKEIADIADMVLQQRRALRLLLISGPSSSGKTSFAQRLSTQLQVNGFKPVSLSLDDYFRDREQTPLDKEGKYDFDAFEALDLELLQNQISQLINGEIIEAPTYDFVSGRRSEETKTLAVGPTEILIIEGLHAFNPKLVSNINRNLIFKIYVSALGGLNIDLVNRLPTTESRLIRRLVRDDRYRNIGPEATLDRWASVRKGEQKNIFPFQEDADVMFNSSMLYEMNALRPFAEASLKKVTEVSPYFEAKERLMNLLSFFEPMDVSKVPFNSILREFIGGSIYFNQG